MMRMNEMGVQATQTEVFAPATSMAVPAEFPSTRSTTRPQSTSSWRPCLMLSAIRCACRSSSVWRMEIKSVRELYLPVTKSTCTHHFKVLREAGVIRQRLEGTTRLDSLRREELEQRFRGCSVRGSAQPASAAPVNVCPVGRFVTGRGTRLDA